MKKDLIGVFGNVSVDITVQLERIPGEYEKGEASSLRISGGGSAANTAYWLGKMKERVIMFGCVGKDIFGDIAIDSLRSAGVDVSGIRRIQREDSGRSPYYISYALIRRIEEETGVAIILTVPGKDKRMIRYRGANRFSKLDVEEAKRRGISYLHMASNTYHELKKAKEGPWKLSYDPGPDLPKIEDLDGIWAFLPNEVEARRIFRKEKIEEILKEIPSEIAVIKGVNGKIWGKFGKKTWELGPLKVKGARDSTGCGDAFNAGFLKGILGGLDPKLSSAFALACSTLNYKVLGARHPDPKFEDLKEILKENGLWEPDFEDLSF